MPPPPLIPPDPYLRRTQQQDHVMDALDASNTCSGRRNWADKMDEVDQSPSPATEDDLMEAWLEATRSTTADGDVVLAPTVVKLVTALLRKVTTALKDSHQANQRIDHLEACLTKIMAKPHSLPPKPTGWATVAKQAAGHKVPKMPSSTQPTPPPAPKAVNEFKASALVIRCVLDQTPFEGMMVAQIVQNVNLALETIGTELDGQAICITAVAVLRPLGDIKMYMMTCAQARWLMEQKHKWSTIADPCLVMQATCYSVVLHSVPAEVQLASPEFLSCLLAQNLSIMPHALHLARWLSNPEVTKKLHRLVVVNFLDKDLP
ncbi:hypothetical protein CROQUDRAFT_93314 [Cronartium quercuum f. sp. fusiforme G11]|uniref:Uncharacterized protein n=1 Tax=Cronartium quercuum f. sp. fusiforme G11 TaxID=708437 RepID=A0A9P6NKJ6_9BASI|nr:hypothetical protein CROQUDRAFT_93314 [Cronartium quercuum f. sp. fusiforme G11]